MGFYIARRFGRVPFGSICPNQCMACLPACEAPVYSPVKLTVSEMPNECAFPRGRLSLTLSSVRSRVLTAALDANLT